LNEKDAHDSIAELDRWATALRMTGQVECSDALYRAIGVIEAVQALHRRFTYYELEDSCPDTSEEHREEHHHESEDIGEFYCDQLPTGDVCCDSCVAADGERLEWPCPTIQAIETKEVAPDGR